MSKTPKTKSAKAAPTGKKKIANKAKPTPEPKSMPTKALGVSGPTIKNN
ncbi:MAG TPA: hypothetical protein VIE67_09765 [Rudaea sp.]|jgi:hypothetical protein